MIHQLSSMIGSASDQTRCDGIYQINGVNQYGEQWVRAVPMPFYGGLFDRLRDAWSVLRGECYAVRWPKAGELEAALRRGQYARIVPRSRP